MTRQTASYMTPEVDWTAWVRENHVGWPTCIVRHNHNYLYRDFRRVWHLLPGGDRGGNWELFTWDEEG